MKRLFLAINFPDEIKKDIYKYIKSFNWPNRGLSLTNWHNYHITLEFFGDSDQFQEREIINKIEEKFRGIEPITIKLKSIKIFPVLKDPRYVVVEVEDHDILKDIRPHITLVRLKEKLDKKVLEEVEQIKFKPIGIKVEQVDLMKSEPAEGGSIYTIEKSFKLNEPKS